MKRAGEARGRPFLKWAGGKRQLLPDLLKRLPPATAINTYHEPFVGGGAVFFALRPKRAVLYDMNERLIRTYRAVRDQVEDVIAILREYPNDPEFFYELRARAIDAAGDAEMAAWMIYLNKTGFNGLYRVNSKNIFNVPFGRYKNPKICNAALLRGCAQALQSAELVAGDFAQVAERTAPGDAVYFDPPYVPVSKTANFTAYTKEDFGPADQERLRDAAVALKARGIPVVISNAAAGRVEALYGGGSFAITEVYALRQISAKGDGRGAVSEYVIV